jgi:hypothetical protein
VLAGIVESLKDILLRKVVLHAFEGFGRRVRHGIRGFDGCDLGIFDPFLIIEGSASTSRDDQAAYNSDAVRALHSYSPPVRRNLSRARDWCQTYSDAQALVRLNAADAN